MKLRGTFIVVIAATMCLQAVWEARGQGSPDIIWEAATPNTLANSIQGVGWSPSGPTQIAFGSTDRWLRTRNENNGALIYSVLQPIRSGGANQTIYSSDGSFLAVHNSTGGLGYRVHGAADGSFLGSLIVTVGNDQLVHFAPDTNLLVSVGGDGTLSRWHLDSFTVSLTIGSGYDRTNTTFNFSPDGLLQSAASQGTITIRRRSDAQVGRLLKGGLLRGSTPAAFTPNSAAIAAWSDQPNAVTLWRISDGAALLHFPGAATNEGVSAIRFTPDGAHLVTTGYLPFIDTDGLWRQKGVIRFWRVADGALLKMFDDHTGIAVTSPVAWSPDVTRFAYGTYEGTAIVARTPVAPPAKLALTSIQVQPDGNVLVREFSAPGEKYSVEASTNMLQWRELGTSTANANGYCEFLDTNTYNASSTFYRFRKSQ